MIKTQIVHILLHNLFNPRGAGLTDEEAVELLKLLFSSDGGNKVAFVYSTTKPHRVVAYQYPINDGTDLLVYDKQADLIIRDEDIDHFKKHGINEEILEKITRLVIKERMSLKQIYALFFV